MRSRMLACGAIPVLAVACGPAQNGGDFAPLSAEEFLGGLIFFDEDLSVNRNQSCASCHGAAVGWTGPLESSDAHGAVHEGAIAGRFGARKPGSSAYAAFSPVLHLGADGEFVGGNFSDGRATGERLGNPAAEQAQEQLLDPVGQALPDAAAVVARVCSDDARYAPLFRHVWGQDACDDVDEALVFIARSVVSYEASSAMSPFSSKFDAYLAGEVELTELESQGLELFEGQANCANCHDIGAGEGDARPLLTDFTFANIGAPRNPENPFYAQSPEINPDGPAFVDPGLGGFLATRTEWAHLAAENHGKHRVPTLRNVDKRPDPSFVKAYGHNGYFKSLAEIVHFYNTRDILPTCAPEAPEEKIGCWPAPEVVDGIATDETGNLGLTIEEEVALVAFLQTLSDGYTPPTGGGTT